MNALLEQQGELLDAESTRRTAGIVDRTLEIAADALRLPPWDAPMSPNICPGANGAASRCARSCCPSPTCCCWMSRPTIWTPKASPGSSSFSPTSTGTVVAVTHDRYFLDNVAGWILELDRGRGIPFEGNYTALAGKRRTSAWRRKPRRKSRASGRSSPSWNGCAPIPKARQAKSKARLQRFEELDEPRTRKHATKPRSCIIPPGERLGEKVIDVSRHVNKGFRRPPAHRGPGPARFPRAAIVGIIGANGAGKSTLFKLHHRRRRRRTQATVVTRRHRGSGLRRPEPRCPRTVRKDGLGGNLRRAGHSCRIGKIRGCSHAATCRRFNFKGLRPAETRWRSIRR